jgi:NitT/TauT family transport system ATP-binding protein
MKINQHTNPLEFRAVDKAFDSPSGEVLALRDVSFEVPAGEFVSVVGPSGCGKSTLLRLAAGLILPSSGQVFVDGAPAHQPSQETTLGMVFQSPVLMPWRSVARNVALPMELQGWDKKRAEARTIELLEVAGLTGFERHRIWQLSGGMQQRVAICRALALDPDIILMDEPFGALDALTREELNLYLARLSEASHKSVLFVTHSITEAVFLADRVIVMSARPGYVIDVVDVGLPRPREKETQFTPGFGALSERVYRGVTGQIAAAQEHSGSELVR